ncbi:Tyr recombinase domain-containing protein [Gammaproteobacteria bacterium]
MRKQKPDGLILRGGIWYIKQQVRYGEQRTILRESTGYSTEDRAEAEKQRDRRIAETINRLRQPEPIKAREHTFAEAAVEYILSLERRGKDAEREILAIKSVDDTIGNLPLSHVHQGALAVFEQRCRSDGLSSGTVARTYTAVSAVLNHAARVLRDGSETWLRTAVPKISPPDWGDAKLPYRLTWDEQDKLLLALDTPDRRHLVAPVLFGVWTGARQAEIVGLSWDWERQIEGMPRYSAWWVPAEVRKSSSQKTLSQQSGRWLIANKVARSVIAGQERLHASAVFPGGTGHLFRINNHGWRSAWRESGLPVEGYRVGVHNLRHTFAERLAETGATLDIIQRILGHDGGGVTSRYTGPVLRQMLAAVELIERETISVPRPVSQICTHVKNKVA